MSLVSFKNLSTDQMAEFKATKKKLDKVVNDKWQS